jgi:hypothetical protein
MWPEGVEDINQLKCSILPKSYSFGKYSVTDSLSAHDNKIERKGPNNSRGSHPVTWEESGVWTLEYKMGEGFFIWKISRVRFKTREKKNWENPV